MRKIHAYIKIFGCGFILATSLVFADPYKGEPGISTAQEPSQITNSPSQRPGNAVFFIIVNPKNDVANVDKKFLSDVFLKKISRWKNNELIRPVDLRSDSSLRRKFSEKILNRSVAEVKNYWQQKIFAGYDLPPPELDVDAEIVKYVLKYPGGIGYISGDTNIENTNVKILSIK